MLLMVCNQDRVKRTSGIFHATTANFLDLLGRNTDFLCLVIDGGEPRKSTRTLSAEHGYAVAEYQLRLLVWTGNFGQHCCQSRAHFEDSTTSPPYLLPIAVWGSQMVWQRKGLGSLKFGRPIWLKAGAPMDFSEFDGKLDEPKTLRVVTDMVMDELTRLVNDMRSRYPKRWAS